MVEFSLVFTIVMSVFYIITGTLFLKFPPKEINSCVGYRTSKSSKNQITWDFAQRYSAKLIIKAGIISLVVFPLLVLLLSYISYSDTFIEILIFSQVGELFVIIFLTERALKKLIEEMKKDYENRIKD